MDEIQRYNAEVALLSHIMAEGRITFDELTAVARKMAVVRTTDDGFGKVVVEMTRSDNEERVRIRMIQDMILRPLDVEREM